MPAQRPAIIAEVVKQIITPSLAGVCFPPCSLLPSLGIRGALERTYCNVFIALQFLPRALRPTQDQEENRMRARRRAMLARKPNVPGARDASSSWPT